MAEFDDPGRERLRRLAGDAPGAKTYEPGRTSAVAPAPAHAGGTVGKRTLAESWGAGVGAPQINPAVCAASIDLARRHLATLTAAHAPADQDAATATVHELRLALDRAHAAAGVDQRATVDALAAEAAPLLAAVAPRRAEIDGTFYGEGRDLLAADVAAYRAARDEAPNAAQLGEAAARRIGDAAAAHGARSQRPAMDVHTAASTPSRTPIDGTFYGLGRDRWADDVAASRTSREQAWTAVASPIAAQLGVDAAIRVDDAPAAHGARGLAHAGVVHLVPSLAPEDGDALHVLAHELVHVAQSRLPAAGTLADAEREADELAAGLVRGELLHQPRIGIAAGVAAANTGAKAVQATSAIATTQPVASDAPGRSPSEVITDAERDLAAIRDGAIPQLVAVVGSASAGAEVDHRAMAYAKQRVQSLLVAVAERCSHAVALPGGQRLRAELETVVATATALGTFVGAEQLLPRVRLAGVPDAHKTAPVVARVVAELETAAFEAELATAFAKLKSADTVATDAAEGNDLEYSQAMLDVASLPLGLINGDPKGALDATTDRTDAVRLQLQAIRMRLGTLRQQATALARQLASADRPDTIAVAVQTVRPALVALHERFAHLDVEAVVTGAHQSASAARGSLGMFVLGQVPAALGVGPFGQDGVKFEVGLAVGVVRGGGAAIADVFIGAVDMAKLALAYSAAMLVGKDAQLMCDVAAKLGTLIENAPELAAMVGNELAAEWLAASWFGKGELIGKIVGYLGMSIALAAATGTESLEAELAARGDALAALGLRLLRGIDAAANPLTLLKPLASAGRFPRAVLDWLARWRRGAAVEARAATGAVREVEVGGVRVEVEAAGLLRAVTDELGAIPVARAAATDTYLVAPADGKRMLELLAQLPGVETREWKTGFLVRRFSDGAMQEWYFELGEHGAQAETGARVMDGLPVPNATTVELWGFRGVRTIHGRPRAEWTAAEVAEVELAKQAEPLIYAGHVGISLNGGKTVFGLTPKTPDSMGVNEALRSLMSHEAFPAKVRDDTHVFELAQHYAAQGWNTQPISAVELVDSAKKLQMVDDVARMTGMAPGEHGIGYSFPLDTPEHGEHYAPSNGFAAGCVRNCATYPAKVGLSIPEQSGNLKRYMPELESWVHEDGPKDFRTAKGAK